MDQPSTRAKIITRRTYNRPLDSEGFSFETWEQTIDRVIGHQRWLWKRVGKVDEQELTELRQLMLERKVSVSGRTLWLGGTEVAKNREASQFNCSFGRTTTVHDVVDAFWLLLQGCGVGFRPIVGVLNGFAQEMEVEVIRSSNSSEKGYEKNIETVRDDVWTIKVGDSAEAWAKVVGKILAMKKPAKKLVLDFSEIRKPGIRLSGYGWISSGDVALHKAMVKIAAIMNKAAGRLLTAIEILDIYNWLGTTLSSRRSAEIAVYPSNGPEWEDFALAKKDWWEHDNEQRQQSNNSLMFYTKPKRSDLKSIFDLMMEAGGSEPGFINAEAAMKRAPWFQGVNPCAEILLGDKSFCNLVEVDLGKFNSDWSGLIRALFIIARANYRQTCVNLDDGVLQRSWHELNEFLRLCGVGLTGIQKWRLRGDPQAFSILHYWATSGADTMADELGLPRSKAVTTVKPSGTLSKIMDTTEGVHKPLGKYIFNNVNFSIHDPIIPILKKAGYRMMANPSDETSVLVTFPVAYEGVDFDVVDGKEVNLESAVEQLETYKLLMDNYVDHNCSVTISYDTTEVEEIVDWLMDNWDTYVGVSFIYRNDPTKTAKDLGYAYLPQEVVTKETYDAYAAGLLPVDLETAQADSLDEYQDADCATGACPIR
jgi:adenosylcobalamin-dependent ribonucleoside-triphosphate reductase